MVNNKYIMSIISCKNKYDRTLTGSQVPVKVAAIEPGLHLTEQ